MYQIEAGNTDRPFIMTASTNEQVQHNSPYFPGNFYTIAAFNEHGDEVEEGQGNSQNNGKGNK